MLPGFTLIMKAPGCKMPLKFSTALSGNTCGAVYWTDGKCEAPMLPDQPLLRKSPGEGVVFWSDECEKIGEIYPVSYSDHPDWQRWHTLDWAVEPDEEDYFRAIKQGMGDTPEKLRYLRMRLWWRGNDRIRQGEAEELSDAQLENLRAFEELLAEDDPTDRLMKAEARRERGEFDQARQLLQFEFPAGFAEAVALIRQLCDQGRRSVAVIAGR